MKQTVHSSMSRSGRHQQQGVALLEVMIVFFVLSIGLLGMAALQLKSIQYSQSAYMRSQATVAATDMLDRLRLRGGNEFVAGDAELTSWVALVNGVLPTNGNDPEQNCDAGVCTVSISWEDRFVNETDNSNNTQTVVISSRM